MGGTIERQLGALNVFGIGNGLLDAPYSADVIGDYTGLTHRSASRTDLHSSRPPVGAPFHGGQDDRARLAGA